MALDVTPEDLRDAGKIISEARETLAEGAGKAVLDGKGQHRLISTGGFSPGTDAQAALSNATTRLRQAIGTIQTNYVALASALNIVADVFSTKDAENARAFEFAFVAPGASRPAGLPSYVDPRVTLLGEQRRAAEDTAKRATAGRDMDSGRRSSYIIQVPSTSLPPGAVSHIKSVNTTYDEDGNFESMRVQNTVTYPGGRTEYYTETYDDSYTDPEVSGEWEVGPQPPPFPVLRMPPPVPG